jgi:hypothetical protein
MPRKSLLQEAKESQLVAWYKWQFLRRNVEYRKDYEKFIRQHGRWLRKHGYWYDETIKPWGPKNLRFFATVIAPNAKHICVRWEIRDLFPPDWNFTQLGVHRYRPNWKVSLPTDCSKEEAGKGVDLSQFYLSDKEFEKSLPRYLRAPEHHLFLKFDLRLPLVDLLSQAKEQITSLKAQYDRRHPHPTKTSAEARRRLLLYDKYLKAWDLKENGDKLEYIGALMFSDKRSPLQSAKDACGVAQELIDGGYKKLK